MSIVIDHSMIGIHLLGDSGIIMWGQACGFWDINTSNTDEGLQTQKSFQEAVCLKETSRNWCCQWLWWEGQSPLRNKDTL